MNGKYASKRACEWLCCALSWRRSSSLHVRLHKRHSATQMEHTAESSPPLPVEASHHYDMHFQALLKPEPIPTQRPHEKMQGRLLHVFAA